jgi:hypothetical protein
MFPTPCEGIQELERLLTDEPCPATDEVAGASLRIPQEWAQGRQDLRKRLIFTV